MISGTSLNSFADETNDSVFSDVTKDPETNNYIFTEKAFTELWAYMLFLESSVSDLEKQAENYRTAAIEAVSLSEKAIAHSEQLLDSLAVSERRVENLTIENQKLLKRITPLEAAVITVFGVGAGIGIGLFVGVVAN